MSDKFDDAEKLVRDNGNGCLVYHSSIPEFPSVMRIRVFDYARRDNGGLWYEIVGDPARREYQTAQRAQVKSDDLRSIPTEVLKRELARRK